MKSIGQFAKENDVTVKTLHHYEKMGLLMPHEVDEMTGYRYYIDDQIEQLKNIVFLKSLGFSLSEVKAFLGEEYTCDTLMELLTLKKKQSTQDKESAALRTHRLTLLIQSIENNTDLQTNYKELFKMNQEKLFTGKYGRGQFIEASERMFKEARETNKPLAVVQLDLDYFYQINKKYGYDAGDVVLQRTQDEMVAFLQKYDCPSILERRGGDEFSITIEMNSINLSLLVTKLLNHIVAIDFSDIAEDLNVSVTAGMAFLNKKTTSYTELVQDATIQLYKNKRSRK
jgi:diguanylate cyclase (GGDEF)-like protein